jgi:hypothetical protein
MDLKIVSGVIGAVALCCLFILGILAGCIQGTIYFFQDNSVSTFINKGFSESTGVTLGTIFSILFVIFIFKSRRSTDVK